MIAVAPLIELSEVTVTFSRWGQEVTALEKLSLCVPDGQWLVVVGPNGSGKSTLLKVIAGLAVMTAGRCMMRNKQDGNPGKAKLGQDIFYVHQDPLLGTAPALTVYENLVVADPEAATAGKKALTAKYTQMLSDIGLADRLRQPASTLSGGERQLLALFVARLRPCPVILLDEPIAAMDPVRSERCLEEIARLNEDGKTLVHVTHEPEHAVALGDRTIALNRGQLVYDSTGDARTIEELRRHWYDRRDQA